MARGGEKSSADDSRPERIRPVEVRGEVEDAKLACARCLLVNGGPSAGHQVQDGKQSNERARKINSQLYDIGPDDRGHSALEGVQQRKQGNDADGNYVTLQFAYVAE